MLKTVQFMRHTDTSLGQFECSKRHFDSIFESLLQIIAGAQSFNAAKTLTYESNGNRSCTLNTLLGTHTMIPIVLGGQES